jgi:hypothetical protein
LQDASNCVAAPVAFADAPSSATPGSDSDLAALIAAAPYLTAARKAALIAILHDQAAW